MNKSKVIVTGALGGIGTAIIKKLLTNNYFVIGTIRPGSQHKAENWLSQFNDNEKGSLKLVEVDVCDYEMVKEVFNNLVCEYQSIEALVNNAGITSDSTLKKMTQEQWLAVIDTNLTGCFNTVKAVFDHMVKNTYGRIVNISSINGQKGQFGQVNYSASKAGLYGLSKSVAMEGAKKGITCNSISPGYIRTEMTDKLKPEVLESIVSSIPVGRMGEAHEIAEAVLFLVDEKAAYSTGSNMAINGGQHMY